MVSTPHVHVHVIHLPILPYLALSLTHSLTLSLSLLPAAGSVW